jgi:Flp pilus assembly pilin Flp
MNIKHLIATLETFHNDESGATATEYIVLLVLIACFVIAVVKTFGQTLSSKYSAADELIVKEVRF